jgi:hypothetical protein
MEAAYKVFRDSRCIFNLGWVLHFVLPLRNVSLETFHSRLASLFGVFLFI